VRGEGGECHPRVVTGAGTSVLPRRLCLCATICIFVCVYVFAGPGLNSTVTLETHTKHRPVIRFSYGNGGSIYTRVAVSYSAGSFDCSVPYGTVRIPVHTQFGFWVGGLDSLDVSRRDAKQTTWSLSDVGVGGIGSPGHSYVTLQQLKPFGE
jgi:hypothetical protein